MSIYSFDKNRTYTTSDVWKRLQNAGVDISHTTVSQRFTKNGYKVTNGQSTYRRFSGADCQEVFDNYCEKYLEFEKWKNSDEPVQLAVKEPNRSKLHFYFTDDDDDLVYEITKRSSCRKTTNINVIRDSLREYFSEHPFDEVNERIKSMSREELEEAFKTLFGGAK